MGMYDGYFEIIELDDGIYLELFPAQSGGKGIDVANVVARLKEKSYSGFNESDIEKELVAFDKPKTIKVIDFNQQNGEPTDSVSDPFKLKVSDDNMQIVVTFYPAENIDDQLIVDDIIKKLIALKVNNIPEASAILEIVSNKKCNIEYELLTGKYAVNGQPSTIEYHFKTDKEFKPEIDENGNINYHKLNVVANVKEDQLLATLHLGDDGTPGQDVYGRTVAAIKPKPVRLQFGKNVKANDDKTKLFAKVSGLVKLENSKVVVNDSFEVPNNVGNSTGDIEFAGSVIVNGNVLTGFSVIAKGDIEVLGVVEGANIKAGGNIILHRGIQGMNRAVISAGGNIQTRFIENAEVSSGGNIHSEAILHSKVSAKEEITVEGKKGMISGGEVRSGLEIAANILGSHMGTATDVKVGIDPFLWQEYNDIANNLPKLISEADKLEKVIVLLNKRKEIDGELDEQKKEMYLSATRNKIFINNKISIDKKRVEELRELVERRNDGIVKVKNILYPGTKVSIGSAKYIVREELKYCKLYKDGADVRITSL